MNKIILALFLALWASTTRADEPPPVPDGGLLHERHELCVDAQTGMEGTCYYSHDKDNNRYNALYVNDLAWVIYKLVDGVYVEIWRREPDV